MYANFYRWAARLKIYVDMEPPKLIACPEI